MKFQTTLPFDQDYVGLPEEFRDELQSELTSDSLYF